MQLFSAYLPSGFRVDVGPDLYSLYSLCPDLPSVLNVLSPQHVFQYLPFISTSCAQKKNPPQKPTVIQHYHKTKILDWNTLLIEISGRGKRKKKSISLASLAWLPIQLFCLPFCLADYDRPQHTQAPQSMPHATSPACTHIPRLTGVTLQRPVNINCIPLPIGSLQLLFQMDKTLSNPPAQPLEMVFVFKWTVILSADCRNGRHKRS